MIRADWPTCFPGELLVAVSSKSDGTMLDRTVGVHNPAVVAHRAAFTKKQGVDLKNTVYQRIVYGDYRTYDQIAHVDEHHTTSLTAEVVADALMTQTPGVGLLLPVADCIPVVVYDPASKRVALAHLGRHSTLAGLMQKTITEFIEMGSNVADLIVWFGPSVQKDSYVMQYFVEEFNPEWQPFFVRTDSGIHLDMQGYNMHQAELAGITKEHIHRSVIDTATSKEYFSHSQGETTGRFAVLVMLRA